MDLNDLDLRDVKKHWMYTCMVNVSGFALQGSKKKSPWKKLPPQTLNLTSLTHDPSWRLFSGGIFSCHRFTVIYFIFLLKWVPNVNLPFHCNT